MNKRYDSVRFLAVQEFLKFQETHQWVKEIPPQLEKEQDKRFFYQLLQGMVRHSRLLEAEVQKRLKLPLSRLQKVVLGILTLGVYELLFLDKIPTRATIFETVELTNPFRVAQKKGLVNAVLRNLQRDLEKQYHFDGQHSLAIRTSHPEWMVERWLKHYGEEITINICTSNNDFSGITVCPVPPHTRQSLFDALKKEEVDCEYHSIAKDALVIEQPSMLLKSSVFRQGGVYVQDASSQIFMEITQSLWKGNILDACAAPGGKTIQMLHRGEWDFLIASDVSWQRLQSLKENIQRLKLRSPVMIAADGAHLPFQEETFDAILLDVPCSSTGTLKKNPDIKWTFNSETLLRQVDVQMKILEHALPFLKPFGFLVYSTCSLEVEENEQQIHQFLQRFPEFQIVPWDQLAEAPPSYRAFLTSEGFYKVFHSREMMGFFGAILRRK